MSARNIIFVCIACLTTAASASEELDYFESHIRPALVKHCYECHAQDSKEIGGGLLLDSADGWRIGGDSGPAIEPGKADSSLLIAAMNYDGLEMPPNGKLPADVIDRFRSWINAGAADPRKADGVPSSRERLDIDAARTFWAFQTPREFDPPASASGWSHTDIDRFIDAARVKAGLPTPGDADPIVTLRRLAFDLTGLPPSPETIQQYSNDPTPSRWQRIVDDYIASNEFAEHWGRHWLDVARYADSNGGDFNATFHDAWRYRDFVIDAMATDKPFDHFVRQQIAGDLLPTASDDERAENLIATGFLMIGAKMLSERDKAKLKMDIVDEQIDTVGRAILGLTLGCARCHDHKFDPIPTEDYYALAGIFQSTKVLDGESQKYVSTWVKRDLPVESSRVTAVQQHAERRKQLASVLAEAKKHLDLTRKSAPQRWGGTVVDDVQAEKVGHWKSSDLTPTFVGVGYIHDENKNKGESSVTFSTMLQSGQYEVRVSYVGSGSRSSAVPVEIHHADGITKTTVDQSTKGPIDGIWASLGDFEFSKEQPAEVVIRNDCPKGYVIVDAVQFLAADGQPDKPSDASKDESMIAAAEADVKRAEAALKAHDASAPPPLPRAMAVIDEKQVTDAFLCIRGEVHNRGPAIPRGFLQVISSSSAVAIPEDQSGRQQLADWITDPDNPLTARVIVNRVWMHLLGEGIVRTVDNFGQLGDRPSHPELLDTLAVQFVRDGWSIKRLVRRIVLSRVYRQSSNYHRPAFDLDPANRLLWRGNRKRLPAEAMRDTMLVAAGVLHRERTVAPMASYGVLVNTNDASSGPVSLATSMRRSMYLQIIRGQLPAMLATFDFADPDIIVGRRNTTNVPAQALVMMNNPAVLDAAGRIANRIQGEADDIDRRIELAFLRCVQRYPDSEEIELARRFLGDDMSRLDQYIQVLLASTEYRFLD